MALGEDDIRHPSPQEWVFNVSVFEAKGTHGSLCSLGPWEMGVGPQFSAPASGSNFISSWSLCLVTQASSATLAKPTGATSGNPCHPVPEEAQAVRKASPIRL